MSNISQEDMQKTFIALMDAILPSTPKLGEKEGSEFTLSAYDMGVHEYVIYSLNHYISLQEQFSLAPIRLAAPTAELLNTASIHLLNTNRVETALKQTVPPKLLFPELSPSDRIRVLSMLESLDLDLFSLPYPFKNNGGLVKHITDALNRFAMLGYYSEWPGYGITKKNDMKERKLEYLPLSWKQTGYPGVSHGHRDLRGFLLELKHGGKKNGK
ncbi:hypothetical protein [Bacillus sp. FJAT-44742]|uniref:hypothetical protein n=1 Tax=Bacillus sp. FJAT-44742 TaxID=2014005 RepID=UPI000C240BCC|nr:hypothetical protein [Bacillus sp. FJAT-44742]